MEHRKIQAGVDPLKINPIGPPIWSFEEANIFPQGNSNCTRKNSCQGTVLPFIHGHKHCGNKLPFCMRLGTVIASVTSWKWIPGPHDHRIVAILGCEIGSNLSGRINLETTINIQFIRT